ncbi:3-dehydroquinate synthase [Parapedobacter tibetensis]|uniref:3-dehydroquinate synthase n=1 Tax=Parapedobacter tibetensis TaxID=2972951 RepID=UPI00214D36CC|nr:3-dehydroquinate synthase [Parapedobacter tibetensis]
MIKTSIRQSFTVTYQYDVHFTADLFAVDNRLLAQFFDNQAIDAAPKLLVVIDEGVAAHHDELIERITAYFRGFPCVSLIDEVMVVPGGEAAKNDHAVVDRIVDAVDRHGIDRHSYIMAIGGGAVLDAVGYATTIAHRGIRHIRVPTTVLSQNDSGMGVKNGINYQGKKNFIGTFSPPVAVFNDRSFLQSLSHRQWLAGISEAIKVALIKDADFFEWIAGHTFQLHNRDMVAMEYLIYRCAELHLQHIAGADPFEFGSSRPLDFGHWSAHKLEQLSAFEVIHGEAVAIGIALDSVYSSLAGLLPQADAERIIDVLQALGLPVFHPLLESGNDQQHPLLAGLEEFREHLGGRLTIMLLEVIGKGIEVNALDNELILQAATALQHRVAIHS